MDKGQKDKREKNKISPFDITDEMLEDPELDAFLKESLKQEADEIEAELEEDVSLRGIGASDDMFDAIVEELKEQGIWEEESASEKVEQNPALEQDEQTEQCRNLLNRSMQNCRWKTARRLSLAERRSKRSRNGKSGAENETRF